jgi:Family of unknown function (DUF6352)
MSRDFWLSCGHHLLDRDSRGRLLVTDDFLKAYFARPELWPPENACAAEVELRSGLLAGPRRMVSAAQIAAITDLDARDNWQWVLGWRDHLLRHMTLEEAYVDIAVNGRRFPHIFINQLVQVILRNILNECEDAFVLRAAELLFRSQKLVSHNGSLVSLDEEAHADLSSQPTSPLNALLGLSSGAQLDVLNEDNADSYFERSDRFDCGLDLSAGRRGLAALGEVIVRWIRHMLALEVTVLPLAEVRQVPFRWYVGLDAEATRLGDALWAGDTLDETAKRRLVGLYQLNFVDPADVDEKLEGEPSYLMMAMSQEMTLFLKPQNIVTGLPLQRLEAVR